MVATWPKWAAPVAPDPAVRCLTQVSHRTVGLRQSTTALKGVRPNPRRERPLSPRGMPNIEQNPLVFPVLLPKSVPKWGMGA